MSDVKEGTPPAGGDDVADRLVITTELDPNKKWVLLSLKGRLDVFTYMGLSKRLNEEIESNPGLNVILELSGVLFVASSGWSVMLATRTRLKRLESRLVLAGMNEDLTRIHSAMKMPGLVPAYPTAAEAKKALAGV